MKTTKLIKNVLTTFAVLALSSTAIYAEETMVFSEAEFAKDAKVFIIQSEDTIVEETVAENEVPATKQITGKILSKTKKGEENPYILINGKKKYNLETTETVSKADILSFQNKTATINGYFDKKGKTFFVTEFVLFSASNDLDAK